uniref:Zinc finger containing ubiquitin peptidase 1 n=1 Tax=Salvator merianae TaxID=96440 RepID=A0A8D0C1D2_SALMN
MLSRARQQHTRSKFSHPDMLKHAPIEEGRRWPLAADHRSSPPLRGRRFAIQNGGRLLRPGPGPPTSPRQRPSSLPNTTRANAAVVLYALQLYLNQTALGLLRLLGAGKYPPPGMDLSARARRGPRLFQGSPSGAARGSPSAAGENGKELFECPMCHLVCTDYQILQEHVELHLEECNYLEERNLGDLELAQHIQNEEYRQRREAAARQEREDFQKLQRQYGLDGSGGYKKQSLKNMEKEVALGRMTPSEYHKRKADMMESLAFGIDDGKTRTSDHSSVPCIPKIQSLIEDAWKEGFDPQGASHFSSKLQGSKAWIGACEIYSLLTSLRLKCQVIDFHQPTGPSGTHPRLFEWVLNYYSSDKENGAKVVCTSKPPIYLQHQGHSRTIIGIEERKNKSLCLLIFDPGYSSQEMQKLLKGIDGNSLKLLRRFSGSLKHKQYQLVATDGVLSMEEKIAQAAAAPSRAQPIGSYFVCCCLCFVSRLGFYCCSKMAGIARPLSGKVCVVTGASRGIGKGIALQLSEAGAIVYITARHRETLEKTAAEVQARGGKCVPVVCDSSREEEVAALFERIGQEQAGRLDVLVNNAFSGVGAITEQFSIPFWESPVSFWDDINNAGLRGHYICTVYAARLMVPAGRGLIVTISSPGGLRYMFSVPYGVGKAACDRLAADCAVELRPFGVASVALWPGLVRTESLEKEAERDSHSLLNKMLKKRLDIFAETTEASGKCIVGLASDPQVMRHTGKVLPSPDLARLYRFKDVDGRDVFNYLSVRYVLSELMPKFSGLFRLIPAWVSVPKWALSLYSSKFAIYQPIRPAMEEVTKKA